MTYNLKSKRVSKYALAEAIEILKGLGVKNIKTIKVKCPITSVNYIIKNEDNVTIANVWRGFSNREVITMFIPSQSPIISLTQK